MLVQHRVALQAVRCTDRFCRASGQKPRVMQALEATEASAVASGFAMAVAEPESDEMSAADLKVRSLVHNGLLPQNNSRMMDLREICRAHHCSS